MPITAKSILKKIGCPYLELIRGEGYWYFVFDDYAATGRYETHSVYMMYLNQSTIDMWVNIGRDFVQAMEDYKND